MPRRCSICTHPDRAEIDAALVRGDSIRGLAPVYAVSASALGRHKRTHLPEVLSQAHDAAEVAHGDDLLAQVRDLQARARRILDRAERAGDLRVALHAIREARSCLELLARLLGELQEGQTVNVLVLPEWAEVRAAMVNALGPYPEARAAVAGALQVLDAGR